MNMKVNISCNYQATISLTFTTQITGCFESYFFSLKSRFIPIVYKSKFNKNLGFKSLIIRT